MTIIALNMMYKVRYINIIVVVCVYLFAHYFFMFFLIATPQERNIKERGHPIRVQIKDGNNNEEKQVKYIVVFQLLRML